MTEHVASARDRVADSAPHRAGSPSQSEIDAAATLEALGQSLLQSLDGVVALSEVARAESAVNVQAVGRIAVARFWSMFAAAVAALGAALTLGFAVATLSGSAWIGAASVTVLNLLLFAFWRWRAVCWQRRLGFDATRRGAHRLADAWRGEARP